MSKRQGLIDTVKNVVLGYSALIKKVLLFFAVLGIIGLSTCVLVIPLWYFATYAKQLFTIIVLSLSAVGVCILVVVRIKRSVEYHRYYFNTSPIKRFLIRSVKIISKAVFFIICVYLLILLYMRSLLWIAIPLTVVFIFTSGYFLYGRKNNEQQSSAVS